MEKIRLEKSVLAFVQGVVLSVIAAAIAGVGFVLGDIQTVLFSVILEMIGMFVISVFVDNFDAKIEECE
mgnify:CR=1 FL=1